MGFVIGSGGALGIEADRFGLSRPPGIKGVRHRRVGKGDHRRGEQRGINGTSLADGERTHRDSGGHLYDGQ